MARDSEAPSPPLEPSDPGPWPSSDSGGPIERGALKRLELTREVARRVYEDTIGCSWSRLDSSRQSSSNNSPISLACNRVTARRPPLPRSRLGPVAPALPVAAAESAPMPARATTPQNQNSTKQLHKCGFSRVPVGCVCAQRPQVARTSACVECPPTRPRAERICTPPSAWADR
jgi:hypothetical protein